MVVAAAEVDEVVVGEEEEAAEAIAETQLSLVQNPL
jgi:hypothetical protein